MDMRRITAIALLMVSAGVTGIGGDEGRIPLFTATVINQPGYYIVTRDIASASSTPIIIQSNNVTLDLNGHTLSAPAAANVIGLTGGANTGVTIRNGRLLNGARGVGGGGVTPLSLRVEGVEIANSSIEGISIDGAAVSVDVIGCHIHNVANDAIHVSNSAADFRGRFLDNTIEDVGGNGLNLFGLRGGEVRRNVVLNHGSSLLNAAGILLSGVVSSDAGGNIVEDNTVNAVVGVNDEDGIRIEPGSQNNLVVGNVLRRNGRFGIWSQASEARLERNLADHSGGSGFEVGNGASGARNHLEDNQAQANAGCGINFENLNTHAYRNNVVRSNTGGGICNGAAPNTDAGGNIL